MEFSKGLLFGLGSIAALVFVLAIIGGAFAGTSASTDATKHTVSVTGTGYAYAVPDVAKFSTGVVTEANDSAAAMQKNAQLMESVVGALRDAGIAEKDIRTGWVSLEPVYNYYYQSLDAKDTPRIVGYRATNTVTVTVRNLTSIGEVIDATANAGANRVTGVTFELSDSLSAKAYGEALKAAVSQGADKAKTIAGAAGTGSLTLDSVSESGTYYSPTYYLDYAASETRAAGTATTPVSAGEQKVQATVSMVYTFA